MKWITLVVLGALTALCLGQNADADNAATQPAATQPATPRPADSAAVVKAHFIQRLNKLQSFSVTYTHDDFYPSVSKEDHWQTVARIRGDMNWTQDTRTHPADAKLPPLLTDDQIEESAARSTRMSDRDSGIFQLIMLSKATADGAQRALKGVYSPNFGYNARELLEGVGALWPADSQCTRVKPAQLAQTKLQWLDPDHVQIILEDTFNHEKRTLTLDRTRGYAVIKSRCDWAGTYYEMTAEDFHPVDTLLLPMTVKSLHWTTACQGPFNAEHGVFHVSKYVLNDPQNTTAALIVQIPKGVPLTDLQKDEDAKTIKDLPPGWTVTKYPDGSLEKILPPMTK